MNCECEKNPMIKKVEWHDPEKELPTLGTQVLVCRLREDGTKLVSIGVMRILGNPATAQWTGISKKSGRLLYWAYYPEAPEEQ